MGCVPPQMTRGTTSRTGNKLAVVATVLLVAGVISLPLPAFACTCMAYPDDAAEAAAIAYARADAIFLGVVTDVKKKWLRALRVRHTTFDVLFAWKGLSGSNPAVVRSVIGEIGCGYKFGKQGTYLVLASWDIEREILTTNMCELNRKESEAQDLIKEFDKLKGVKHVGETP